jgi:Helix-turn-helix domain
MSLKIFVDDELLTEDEARAEVGVKCIRTLRRWRNLRQAPPHLRIGRKVYYRRGALQQWLLAREQTA